MIKKYSVISTLFIAQRAVIHIDLPFDEAKQKASIYDSGDVYESWHVEETTERDRKDYKIRLEALRKESKGFEKFYNDNI